MDNMYKLILFVNYGKVEMVTWFGSFRVDDVYDLSQCDDEVRTPREDEGYENFNNDSQPINGKTFDTLEAAYDFYNQYALLNGFGTHKHNAHKIRATGAIFRRQFVCNKEGFKKVDEKRPILNEKNVKGLENQL
ncbi:hypothetical protein RJ639_023453 [Escallonia herrerae]|uniref:FAR1 domain-containing protein n=1 Tax=Escallonia herrerae TaxID=1293975 RepID=A0AA89ADV7_9ASTE|nr:hypothetical protein RJ639_023453 [Escallonia herrerae]